MSERKLIDDWIETRQGDIRACVDAIASIGGDPATVGELVAALREMERVFSVTFAGSIFRAETAAILAARSALAKLPGEPK